MPHHQDLRGKEREQEALRAKVDTLESLLQKAAARDQQAEAMGEELNKVRNVKDKVSKLRIMVDGGYRLV